jgi:hypothetical protein
MQGEDDKIVPYKGAALLEVKLLKNPTLKLYPGFPHGMLTTYSDNQPGPLGVYTHIAQETHLPVVWGGQKCSTGMARQLKCRLLAQS